MNTVELLVLLNSVEQAIEGYHGSSVFFKLTTSRNSLQAKKRRLLKKINNGYTFASFSRDYCDLEDMVTLRVLKFS